MLSFPIITLIIRFVFDSNKVISIFALLDDESAAWLEYYIFLNVGVATTQLGFAIIWLLLHDKSTRNAIFWINMFTLVFLDICFITIGSIGLVVADQ